MQVSSQASIECSVYWRSCHIQHLDRYFVSKANFWRDLFPEMLADQLKQANEGEIFSEDTNAGEITASYSDRNILNVREHQVDQRFKSLLGEEFSVGRYYPRGLLKGFPNIYPQDRQPFRFLGKTGTMFRIDLNHPLASYSLNVTCRLVKHLNTREKRGGSCNDIAQIITDGGPGLQAVDTHITTDYLKGEPFIRQAEGDDANFYQIPRMINHLDNTAIGQVKNIYRSLLKNGMQVIDLMSSWNSHLPEELDELSVTGLGLNAEELSANKRLAHYLVHDLNKKPVMPFENQSFDAAICTVSVEYLVKPIEVFNEIARILKPGSPFILTFSDRWFPPKVIKRWTELHPFERMGMVLEYFRLSGRFNDFYTDSIRGLFRPDDDKYANVSPFSDPIYGVWGRVR